jgi:hypothetical protein
MKKSAKRSARPAPRRTNAFVWQRGIAIVLAGVVLYIMGAIMDPSVRQPLLAVPGFFRGLGEHAAEQRFIAALRKGETLDDVERTIREQHRADPYIGRNEVSVQFPSIDNPPCYVQGDTVVVELDLRNRVSGWRSVGFKDVC